MIKTKKHSNTRTDRHSSRPEGIPSVNFTAIAQALIVADYASFSRAAKALGVNQAAVSRRVRALEDNLGVSLFERSPSGVRVTAAGRRFFERTRPAFEQIDSAMQSAAMAGRGGEGVIRIAFATPISDFLADLLKDFSLAHPAVKFEFREGPTRKQIAGIMDRSLDLAFLTGPLKSCDFDSEPLSTSRIFVAMHEKHFLSVGKEIDWTYLQGERFIFGRDDGDGELRRLIQNRFDGIHPRPEVEFHEITSRQVLPFVALGWGLILVSEATVDVSAIQA